MTYTAGDVRKLWRIAREHDCTIPDEALDAMRDALLREQAKGNQTSASNDPFAAMSEYMRSFEPSKEQAKGAQGEAVGEIDWGEDGAFAEFYPDRDLPLGAKLYTAPRAAVPDGYVLVPEKVGDQDAFMVLHEYQQLGRTRKDAYRIAIGRLAERANEMLSAAPSDGGEQGELA